MTNSITSAFMDKIAVSTQASSQNKTSVDSNFKQAFKEASSTNKVNDKDYSPKNKTANSKKQDSAVNENKAERPEKNEAVKPKETETKTPVSENEKINSEKTGQEGEESKEVSKEVSDEIISQVAAALNITAEELTAILASLDIEASDLGEKANIAKVVQTVLGAQSPLELLNMEGVKETFAAVEQAIARAFENVKESKFAATENHVEIKTAMVLDKPAGEAQIPDITQGFADEDAEITPLRSTEEAVSQTQVKTSDSNLASNNENNQQNNFFGEAETQINIFAQTNTEQTGGFNTVSNATQALRNINSSDVVNQIVEKVKIDLKADVTEIKLNLKPEHLGDVSLKIASNNGIITAQFVAESQRVKEIIEANFNALKDVLTEQGINISELSVSVSSEEPNSQMQEFLEGRAKSQGRISSIISAIEEEELTPEELEQKEIYKNNVNYVV